LRPENRPRLTHATGQRPPAQVARALRAGALLGAVSLVGGALGCGPPYCAFRGTINEPSSRTMRRAMLKKGMGDFCQQLLERNAPLRLSPDSPVIGRFYPTQCVAPDGEDLYASFSGFGYAYTNVSRKTTFRMQAAALYKYDFLVTEGDRCDVYAYFRTARVDASNFGVHRIEGGAASMLNQLTQMGDSFGKQLLSKKLAEGFTVVHYAETNVDDFALGILPLGQRPFHPYQVVGKDRVTYENERTEIHQNQRDFVGPIKVEGDGKSLYLAAAVDGAPTVDVLLLRKSEGDASLQVYFDQPQSGPLSGVPVVSDVVQHGLEWKRAIPVPPGMYYVVFDNTPSAGLTNPPANALDDRAAVVNYLIQIGDAS
jgi:hypothetical protein